MDQEVKDALAILRRQQRRMRDRARRLKEKIGQTQTPSLTSRVLEYESMVNICASMIAQYRWAINRWEKLEKLDKKEATRLKAKPVDKTAGRNMLRPRLGR